jgi:hypothetical protein
MPADRGRGVRSRGWLVVSVAVTVAALAAGCSSGSDKSASSSTTRSTASSTTTSTTAPLRAGDLPLYPFANLQEVEAWQQSSGSGGSQAEYLDSGLTALAFARFLGYTDIDQVVTSREDAAGAHVAVGFRNSDSGNLTTAAVVRLVRYGSGSNVPWEVVGTDDTDFSFTAPAYGAQVTSPVSVGGRISGVDESITVHVQQLHSNGLLGQRCCIPGGGTNQPWSGTVTFSDPTDPVLIVSASTGGHVQDVERFTVTAAKSAVG